VKITEHHGDYGQGESHKRTERLKAEGVKSQHPHGALSQAELFTYIIIKWQRGRTEQDSNT